MSETVFKLPSPRDKLAGCVWLPRIVAKARLFAAGKLPEDYASRFGHVSGVDGYFLTHFRLTRDEILAMASQPDAEFAGWFASRIDCSEKQIAEWNHIAVNLGRPGFPMAERFPVAKATIYKHVAKDSHETVFEVLEADEGIEPPAN